MKKTALVILSLTRILMLTLLASCSQKTVTTTAQGGGVTTKPSADFTTDNGVTSSVVTDDNTVTSATVTSASVTTEGAGVTSGVTTESNEYLIGTPEELSELIFNINSSFVPSDVNITLTDDIDLTGYVSRYEWEPIYRYSGVFDGAGHSIKNLDWTFLMVNSAESDMPTAETEGSFVVTNMGGVVGNCWAEASISLLVVVLDGGEIKNLTMEDCSVNIECSYNKNYQMFIAGMCGYIRDGKITDCNLKNVDVTIPSLVCYNEAYPGYASLFAGRAEGESVVSGCTVDDECLVDSSQNVKFNISGVIGYVYYDSYLEIKDTDTSAELLVCTSPTLDVEGMMYTGADSELGGLSDEYVALSNGEYEIE